MKRNIILIVLIMLLISTSVFANKFSEIDQVTLTDNFSNKEGVYQPINLLLKGKDVISDVPGILYEIDGETRTLVPVRFITEELGAEVEWNGEEKSVLITNKNKKIKLIIDEPYAFVNDKKQALPSNVPAKLLSYNGTSRTMVPVRFISEEFDLDVDWVGDTQTVAISSKEQSITGLDFKYKIKFPEIRFKTSGYVDINEYSVDSKDFGIDTKMIFSLPNTILEEDKFKESTFLKKENGIINYKIDLFGINDLTINQEIGDIKSTTIELDLQRKKGFETFYDYETNEIVIRLVDAVESVKTKNIYNSKALIIGTKEDNPDFSIKKSDGRIVIDVINSKLKFNNGHSKKISINENGIKNYEFYQLDTSLEENFSEDDKVTRVILNLEDSKSIDDVYVEAIDDEIFAYVSGNPLNGFEYVRQSNAKANLGINFLEQGTYSMNLDKVNNKLELTFLKSLVEIDEMDLNIDDQIVNNIKIKQSDDQYIVQLELKESVKIVQNTKENNLTDEIALELTNMNIINSKYRDKLIVIDPGHGGKDPGAIGTNSKITESELVLKAGLDLKEKLEAKGFKVYITRDRDEYVDLYQRPKIANKLGADLFISIHINAFSDPKAEGIEVLYAKDEKRNSYNFAKNVKDYLITYLNRVDRGVKNRPRLVVLKYTEMPAILTELGFLTNPTEEKMLLTDEYMESAVNAMYKGILDEIK